MGHDTPNSSPNGRPEARPRGALIALTALVALACACGDDSDGTQVGDQPSTNAGGPSEAPPATVAIDRSGLTDVGVDAPLDYADARLWLCRPGNDPDECDRPLDATELLPDGSRTPAPHVKASAPGFDCFYVYPTVKLDSADKMTNFAAIEPTLDPLLAQGARFSRVCSVYAPLYRQQGVVPGAGGAPMGARPDFALGANDVQDAFKYYLEHLGQGRKFVLIGHSQGTGMLTALLRSLIDGDPALRERLLSALLIGGGVEVPPGQAVGGTFQNIPLCTQAGQTGCVISYVSYSAETPPSMTSTFGRPTTAGMDNACTEPAALAGRAGQRYQGSYIAMKRVNATFQPDGFDQIPTDIPTPFVVYRDLLRGTCKSANGATYLEISLEMAADDPRPSPPYRYAAIESALGLHLADYNLELDDLIEAVRLQAAAAGVE